MKAVKERELKIIEELKNNKNEDEQLNLIDKMMADKFANKYRPNPMMI